MSDWYVYREEGEPIGPWSTAQVAEAVLDGTLSPEAWVAAPGGSKWLRALDVPVIAQLVDGIPTRQVRVSNQRASGLRIVPGTAPTGDIPIWNGTVMMVKDGEAEIVSSSIPATSRTGDHPLAPASRSERVDGQRVEEEEDEPIPSTDPALPPSSTTPTPSRSAAKTDEMPARRRKNA